MAEPKSEKAASSQKEQAKPMVQSGYVSFSTGPNPSDIFDQIRQKIKVQETLILPKKESKPLPPCLNLPSFSAVAPNQSLHNRSPLAKYFQSKKENTGRSLSEPLERILDKNAKPMMTGWTPTKKIASRGRHLQKLNITAPQMTLHNHDEYVPLSNTPTTIKELSDDIMFLRKKLYHEERTSKAAFVSFEEYVSQSKLQREQLHSPDGNKPSNKTSPGRNSSAVHLGSPSHSLREDSFQCRHGMTTPDAGASSSLPKKPMSSPEDNCGWNTSHNQSGLPRVHHRRNIDMDRSSPSAESQRKKAEHVHPLQLHSQKAITSLQPNARHIL